MHISIAICTHNEGDYIRQLLTKLDNFIVHDRSGDVFEIVIVDDFSNDTETQNILMEFQQAGKIKLFQHALNNNYSEHKNFLNKQCIGEWILNLDADEFVSNELLGFLSTLIEINPGIEAYGISRVNTVDGLTLKHVRKWNWILSKMDMQKKIRAMDSNSDEYKLLKDFDYIISEENGIVTYFEPIIMWPDYQVRLYKNDPNRIKWINRVHERLTGFDRYGILPETFPLAIKHYKTIARQENQNAFYETL